MNTPPHPFEANESLAADPVSASRARTLGAALDAIPEFQRWLRQARQQAVTEMRDSGMSYSDIGTALGGISKARVQQILEGRSSGHHPAKQNRPAPPSEDGQAAGKASVG